MMRMVCTDSVENLRNVLLEEYSQSPDHLRPFYGSGAFRDRLTADLALKRWPAAVGTLEAVGTRLWSLPGGLISFKTLIEQWVVARLALYHSDAAECSLLGDLNALGAFDWIKFVPKAFCAYLAPGRQLDESKSEYIGIEPSFEFIGAEPYDLEGTQHYVIGREHVMALIYTYFRSRPLETSFLTPAVIMPIMKWNQEVEVEEEVKPRLLIPSTSGMTGVVVPSPHLTVGQVEAVLELFFHDRGVFMRMMSECKPFITASFRDTDQSTTQCLLLETFPVRGRSLCCFSDAFDGSTSTSTWINDIDTVLPRIDETKPKKTVRYAIVRNNITGHLRILASDSEVIHILSELAVIGELDEPPPPIYKPLFDLLGATIDGSTMRQLAHIFTILAASDSRKCDPESSAPDVSQSVDLVVGLMNTKKNASHDLRSEVPNPTMPHGPWMNSTIQDRISHTFDRNVFL